MNHATNKQFMNVKQLLLIGLITSGAYDSSVQAQPASIAFTTPPAASVREVTDDYFGTRVVDSYRWMEDMRNPELQSWMKAQADYSRAVLDSLPGRRAVLARFSALDQSAPVRVRDVRRFPGDRYFYLKTLAGENTAKLYMREGLTGRETLLVDPERMSAGGASPRFSLSYYEPSWDGRLIAVGVAPNGSENTVIRVLETATGRETGEAIDRARYGGVSWRPDNRSFFYTRLQSLPPNAPVTEFQQKARAYLHTVGTAAEQDRAVFGNEVSPNITIAPALHSYVVTTPNSRFALGLAATGVGGGITAYVAPLSSVGHAGTSWRKICDPIDQVTDVAVRGDDLYLVTSKDAPRYKVMRVDLNKPDLSRAAVLVPPGEAVVGGDFAGSGALHIAQDALYVQLLDGGIGRLLRVPFDQSARPERVPLGFEGTIISASANPQLPGVLIEQTSWVRARAVYAFDPQARRTSEMGLQPLGPHDRPADLEATEVKVSADDGTQIPLSIIHRRGLRFDGSNPTLLHGYGAYGISQLPSYDPKLLAWYERGGVYAVAHVRGGGEYGEEWHQAGQKEKKPNTWRDFIKCAEYLIARQYTSRTRLAGMGQSAGGILIGRAVTERPDLFGAAIIGVGVNDTLRFETTANGIPNIPEFGSVKTPEGFKSLYEMSAYHHVRDKTSYPAVLLTHGINDPRVAPWLSAKMAARLQAATASSKPVLLRIDYNSGHGIGSTRRQFVEEMSDIMSFLLWQFDDPSFQSNGAGQTSESLRSLN